MVMYVKILLLLLIIIVIIIFVVVVVVVVFIVILIQLVDVVARNLPYKYRHFIKISGNYINQLY